MFSNFFDVMHILCFLVSLYTIYIYIYMLLKRFGKYVCVSLNVCFVLEVSNSLIPNKTISSYCPLCNQPQVVQE